MRIGIDIQPLQYPARFAGIGYYLRNLIFHLWRLDKNNEYILFTNNKASRNDGLGLNDMIAWERRNLKSLRILKNYSWIWDKLYFSSEMNIAAVSLFHSNSIAEGDNIIIPRPSKKCKVIVTVHDLIPIIFKAEHPFYWSNKSLSYNFGRKLRDIEKADAIIAVSESTKSDIQKYLNFPSNKIFVVYEAIDESFKVVKDEETISEAKTKHNLPDKIILYVGGYYSARKIRQN